MATVLQAGRGDLMTIHPKKHGVFTLGELMYWVKGHAELIPVSYLGEPRDLVVNAFGGAGWKLNKAASSLAGRPIHGDAVLLEAAEWSDHV